MRHDSNESLEALAQHIQNQETTRGRAQLVTGRSEKETQQMPGLVSTLDPPPLLCPPHARCWLYFCQLVGTVTRDADGKMVPRWSLLQVPARERACSVVSIVQGEPVM